MDDRPDRNRSATAPAGGSPDAPAAADPVYRLRGIRVRRGEAVVLDVPALDLARGGFHCFVGPNGAGKTMMLGLLSLLEPPTEGELYFDGARLFPGAGPAPETARRVTLVAQDPYLFDATAAGNVAYGLRRRGMSRAAARVAADEALALAGLSAFASRRARTLSGGEGKRLALARALALRPDVLLLDEPLANVDAANALRIEELVRDVLARTGVTVIATTHDLGQPHRLGARIHALYRGRLVDAPPDNVFSGEIVERDGEKRFRIGGDVEIRVHAERTGPACVAIDARGVRLSKAPLDAGLCNRHAGPVVATALGRDHVRVTVDIGVPLVAWIAPQSLREMGLGPGDRVEVAFKAEAVSVFSGGGTASG